MSGMRGRPRLESEGGEKLCLYLLPSTKKILDDARGNVPRSVAMRIILNTLSADPSWLCGVLGTKEPVRDG